MTPTPEVVGYVDRLGYLRCVACTYALETGRDVEVRGDTSPHPEEPCEHCKYPLLEAHATLRQMVRGGAKP